MGKRTQEQPVPYYTMRDLPQQERPRERLVRYGADKLSGEELLAVLISRGTAGVPVREIANKLLRKYGSIAAIADATIEELKGIEGIGTAKACQLKAAFELARRLQESQAPTERKELNSPEAVFRLLKPELAGLKKEKFITVLLDVRNRLIRIENVSIGSLDTTIARPREVFEPALRDCARSIIMVHNHPSGDPTPSDDDIRLTRRLVEAGKLLDITVQDHVIIAGERYYSFRSHALL
jgi:DNA repair protein RadC